MQVCITRAPASRLLSVPAGTLCVMSEKAPSAHEGGAAGRELRQVPADYPVLLAGIKERIRLARARAIMAVNAEFNALTGRSARWLPTDSSATGGVPVSSLGWLAICATSFPRRRGSQRATSTGCLPSTVSTRTSKFRHRLWRKRRTL